MKNLISKRGVTILLGAVLVVGFFIYKPLPISQIPEAHAQTAPTQIDCPTRQPADIILVMDDSGTMSIGTRQADAINAAKIAVDVIMDFHPDNRIGVAFMNAVGNDLSLSSNKNTIKSRIDGLATAGTTPTISTLDRAKGMLNLSDNKKDIIVFFSDGGCNSCKTKTPTAIRNQLISTLGSADWNKLIIAGIGLEVTGFKIGPGPDPIMDYIKAFVTDPNVHAKNAASANMTSVFTNLVKQLIGGNLAIIDPDQDGHWPYFCANVTDNLCKSPIFGNRPCDDRDDLNEYVRPNAPEGECNPKKSDCSIRTPGGTWTVGGTDYLNCTDYYADTDLSASPPSGLTCTKTTTAANKDFYTCTDDDGNPTYLSSNVINSVNAVLINNNQIGGANKAELSCPKAGGLVPCGRYADDPATPEDESEPCGFCHFFSLFDRIMGWIILRIAPLTALLLLIIGGLAIATSRGSASQLTRGKDIVLWTLVGYAVMLIGWMVLNSFFAGMGIKTWTGFAGESGDFESITTPARIEIQDTNKTWMQGEWEGLVITINHPSWGDPETRKIISNTTNQITVDSALPSGSASDMSYTIGGWWQFSCEIPTVSAPPNVTLTLNPNIIANNSFTTLSWDISGATTCEASGSWSGSKLLTGNENVTPQFGAGWYLYRIECQVPGKPPISAHKKLYVKPPPPIRTVNLQVNGSQSAAITPAGTANLSWDPNPQSPSPNNCVVQTSINTTTNTNFGNWNGNKAVSAGSNENILFQDQGLYSLHLTCYWPDNSSATNNVIVEVSSSPSGAPPTTQVPQVILSVGEGTTTSGWSALSNTLDYTMTGDPDSRIFVVWASQHGTTCNGTGGVIGSPNAFLGAVASSPQEGYFAIAEAASGMLSGESYTFTYTCSNNAGSTSSGVTLNIL